MKNYLEIIRELRRLQKNNYRGEITIVNSCNGETITSSSYSSLMNIALKSEALNEEKYEKIFILKLV